MTRPFSMVRDWCAQHPSIIAVVAVSVAMIGRQAAKLVRIGEATNQGAVLPLHRDLDHWLSLYRQHRRLAADMGSVGRLVPDIANLLDKAGGILAEFQDLPNDLEDIRDPRVMPLPCGPNGGYLDRFNNEWVKGPSRTAGEPFEWDVQLSRTGKHQLGWMSPDRNQAHINVSLGGEVTH